MSGGTVRQRLAAKGLTLPEVYQPTANYVATTVAGKYLFIAGVGPTVGRKVIVGGRVGAELTTAQGREGARLTALNALANADAAVGLDRIRRACRMFGLVRCTPDFTDLETVFSGADEVIGTAFGDSARPAWAMVGSPGLPIGIAVEIESIFELI
jgi:enamine deaminase RidA (YjgF/YER057c/UK114 family)